MEKYINQLKNQLVKTVSENPNLKKLLSEAQKINGELTQKKEELNKAFQSEKTKRIAEAQTRYNNLLKKVATTQKDLDKELKKAGTQLKKTAADAQKNIEVYRKKAVQQKAKLEKTLKSKLGAKTAKKKRTKKATV